MLPLYNFTILCHGRRRHFFRGTHKVRDNLGPFSIIYFGGLELRVRVCVRVMVSLVLGQGKFRDRVRVRVGFVLGL